MEYFLTTSSVWHVLSHGRFYERITAEYLCLQKWLEKTEKWTRKETRTWASSADTNTPKALCCRHVEWQHETLHEGAQRLSSRTAHKWLSHPPLLPPETLRALSTANQKDKLCLSSQRWPVKYSFPLKGNGCFCSFLKSLCSKQEELHVVSSYAPRVSYFYWSIHCSHIQNPGGGETGQGASFCFLFNGYDPFLQSKSDLDGDKYAALIQREVALEHKNHFSAFEIFNPDCVSYIQP